MLLIMMQDSSASSNLWVVFTPEGTKIMQADEFDYMVNLSRLTGCCEVVYRRKRLVLLCVSSRNKDDLLHSWSEFCEKISDISDTVTGKSLNDGNPVLYLDGS